MRRCEDILQNLQTSKRILLKKLDLPNCRHYLKRISSDHSYIETNIYFLILRRSKVRKSCRPLQCYKMCTSLQNIGFDTIENEHSETLTAYEKHVARDMVRILRSDLDSNLSKQEAKSNFGFVPPFPDSMSEDER